MNQRIVAATGIQKFAAQLFKLSVKFLANVRHGSVSLFRFSGSGYG